MGMLGWVDYGARIVDLFISVIMEAVEDCIEPVIETGLE
jgi:hypothetical protein